MLRTLINRTMSPGFNLVRLNSSFNTSCLPPGEMTKQLLTLPIEWKSLSSSSPLGNILCCWNQFAIIWDDDPNAKRKFILNFSGEEITRLEVLPTNWQLPNTVIQDLPYLKSISLRHKVT